jgi:hypothetical protein
MVRWNMKNYQFTENNTEGIPTGRHVEIKNDSLIGAFLLLQSQEGGTISKYKYLLEMENKYYWTGTKI